MKKLYILIFFVISLIPAVLVPIMGDKSLRANEINEKPELFDKENNLNLKYLSDVSSYWNKNFALRQNMITVNSKMASSIFNVSPVNDVIVGKDGWLFYKDTINDFIQKETLSDDELETIAESLLNFEKECSENGIKFLFVLAPNKNSIYGEFMPSFGETLGITNREKLFKLLDFKNVSYLNLFDDFNNSSESLYFKLDSHWNSLGASLGADKINESLGKASENFFDNNYTKVKDFDGDLYEMLYPTGKEKDYEYYSNREFSFSYVDSFKAPDQITIRTINENKDGSVMVYRDSFGNSLYPFIAESFNKATFSRRVNFSVNTAIEEEADTLIIVKVERNLKDLLITFSE